MKSARNYCSNAPSGFVAAGGTAAIAAKRFPFSSLDECAIVPHRLRAAVCRDYTTGRLPHAIYLIRLTGAPGRALFTISDTPNFLATNLVDSPRFPGDGWPEHFAGEGVDPRTWNMLIERQGEQDIRTEPLDRPVLYQRGTPRAP